MSVQMQFANIASLIEAFLLSKLQHSSFEGVSLYLYLTKFNPFTLQDTTKKKLISADQNTKELISRAQLEKNSIVCLQNVEVLIQIKENYFVSKIELASNCVRINIGENEKIIKDIQLCFNLQKTNQEYQLTFKSLQYIRRLERKNLVKKYYQPGKIQARTFFSNQRKNKNYEYGKYKLSPQVASLDAQSISLLQRLIHFTNKTDLYQIVIKVPFKDKDSQRITKLAVIPTEVSLEQQDLQIKKRVYNQYTIKYLLQQYKSKEQNTLK